MSRPFFKAAESLSLGLAALGGAMGSTGRGPDSKDRTSSSPPIVPLALIALCRDLSRFPTGRKPDGVLCSSETLPASQVAGRVSVTRTIRPSHAPWGTDMSPEENPGARLIPRRHRDLPVGEMGQTGGPCRPGNRNPTPSRRPLRHRDWSRTGDDLMSIRIPNLRFSDYSCEKRPRAAHRPWRRLGDFSPSLLGQGSFCSCRLGGAHHRRQPVWRR